MAPAPIRLLDHNIPLIAIAVHKQQQETRDEEEDDIHDPKRETRLQHRAGLVVFNLNRAGSARAGAIAVDADAGTEI